MLNLFVDVTFVLFSFFWRDFIFLPPNVFGVSFTSSVQHFFPLYLSSIDVSEVPYHRQVLVKSKPSRFELYNTTMYITVHHLTIPPPCER